MQLDYHYYLIYHVARLAGFGPADAETIAYASQYVDDATEGDPVQPFEDQRFDPVRTAHYGPLGLNWFVQKKIYLPFHFLPPYVRLENPGQFSYVTQCATGAPGESGTRLMQAALLEHDAQFRLIRIGVALHTIADTFAHFGFSGRWHDENDVKDIHIGRSKKRWSLQDMFLSYGDIFIPRIGHLEAFALPDLPYMRWRYRDHDGVEHLRDNLACSLRGAELIYCFLKMAYNCAGVTMSAQIPFEPSNNLGKDRPDVFRRIGELLRLAGNEETRCAAWRASTGAEEYDHLKWRDQALEGNVAWDRQPRLAIKSHLLRLKGKPGFERSNWAYFHRAAWRQRALVTGWLN